MQQGGRKHETQVNRIHNEIQRKSKVRRLRQAPLKKLPKPRRRWKNIPLRLRLHSKNIPKHTRACKYPFQGYCADSKAINGASKERVIEAGDCCGGESVNLYKLDNGNEYTLVLAGSRKEAKVKYFQEILGLENFNANRFREVTQ